jgi:ankyrin repeat protein
MLLFLQAHRAPPLLSLVGSAAEVVMAKHTRRIPRYMREDTGKPTRRDPLLYEFMEAAVHDPERARRLVRSDPHVLNLRTGLGETALHYLAVENHADAVQLLIDFGADVNVVNDFGASPLHEASQVKATATVLVLKNAGAVAGRETEAD